MLCGAPNDDMARVKGSAMTRGTMNRLAANSAVEHLGGVSFLMADCCVTGSVFAGPFIGASLNMGGVDGAAACRTAVIVTTSTGTFCNRSLLIAVPVSA